MQTEAKKSRLENLFIDDTIDEKTVADIEKMLTRKKVENFTNTHSYTTRKEMPGTLQTRRIITSVFSGKLTVNCWMH